jgi:hypothetical protein
MPTTEPRQQHENLEQHVREAQNALIGEQVIHTLGTPDDLHNLQVRRLWEDHYRVNVLIGTGATTARIANSYFVKADSNGNIVRSNPKITKLYSG